MENWKELAAVRGGRTQLNPITWPYDKYPDMPQLMAGASVDLLDVDGPGVVTNLHVSNYNPLEPLYGDGRPADPAAGSKIRMRLFYDGSEVPAIDMPLYDFLGDLGGTCAFYSTAFFSKVKYSHNFRLPIPFDVHLRIVLTNPTDTDLFGYSDIQYDLLDELPRDTGFLHTAHVSGTVSLPETVFTLAELAGNGKIVAQWYAVSADVPQAANGEYICEGNHEFYVNGEEKAAIEYLGSEDCYGYSWGFAETNSDGYAAIIRKRDLPNGGSDIAMLRCRTHDAISYSGGCTVKVDYSKDFYTVGTMNPWHAVPTFASRTRLSFDAAYSSCLYYYKK